MYFVGYNIRIASIEGTVFIITDKRSLEKGRFVVDTSAGQGVISKCIMIIEVIMGTRSNVV